MKTLEAKYFMIALVAVAALSSTVTMSMINSSASNDITAKTSAKMLGHVTAVIYDSDGHIKAYRQSDNMIVSAGMQEIADNVFSGINATSAKMRYIGIGSNGESAPAAGNTALATAIGGCSRHDAEGAVPALPTYVAGTMNGAANANVTLTARFTGATCANGSIDEAGLFNHATGGQMFARSTFSSVNLLASDQLDLTWVFQFTDT